jgi:hypothetical protein
LDVAAEVMAIRAVAHPLAQASIRAVGVPRLVLALTLVAPALDLFVRVQPTPALGVVGLLASGAAAAGLLLVWARFPRTSWLFAASLAAVAGVAMRLVGADVAPALSLLSVVALGIGGAFASADLSLEAA